MSIHFLKIFLIFFQNKKAVVSDLFVRLTALIVYLWRPLFEKLTNDSIIFYKSQIGGDG